MDASPLPLTHAALRGVRVVLSDVDGTLTSAGKIAAGTLRSIEQLSSRGIPVVLVSGRPAGFAECWARTLPMRAVIAENGGVTLLWNGERLEKIYAEPRSRRALNRKRLEREVARAIAHVRGARLSTDSRYTEVDLAIDYNEEVQLGDRAADRLETFLRGRGIKAVRSSVHVNCWVGDFDKAITARKLLARIGFRDRESLYVGDSFNDAPMFAAFPLSVGVANIRSVLSRIDHRPAFITRASEGAGFVEVARAVLKARSH